MENLLNFTKEYWFILAPLLILVIWVLVSLARKGVLKKLNFAGIELEFDRSTEKKTSFELFSRSDSSEFAQRFEKLAHEADRIVLIGTGINILHRDPVLLDLLDRVSKNKCQLEIYLANPFSRQIESRLIEEEIGNIKPPVGKQGLIQRVETILEKQKELGYPPNFVLSLFSNYPTVAMFIVDTDYFLYPYGFALLGNLSPVMQFSRNRPTDRPMVDFMEGQYQRIKSSSTDAQMVMDVYHRRKVSLDKLTPCAVYLIPEAESPLYKFGSQIVGFDVYENRQILSPFAPYVGDAGEFGFHLTVADALYLYHQRDMDLLQKEIEFVVQGLPPIKLELQFKDGFPDKGSVSILCQESQGLLEYLHHEMVSRFYRVAAGSNYDLGAANPNRDENPGRAKWMIQHYHAPYILQKFQPHFTLLTNLPAVPAERKKILDEIERMYYEQVSQSHIELQSIFVLRRPQLARPWQIAKEISFG
ncbi:MAG: hypothetical protein HY865_24900 [Chloroflexi bacterium]|nr:hypothetical protein [Chloroflexota bacterium]